VLNNQTGQFLYPGKQQQQSLAAPPKEGEIVQRGNVRYRFIGGDPSKPSSWEKV